MRALLSVGLMSLGLIGSSAWAAVDGSQACLTDNHGLNSVISVTLDPGGMPCNAGQPCQNSAAITKITITASENSASVTALPTLNTGENGYTINLANRVTADNWNGSCLGKNTAYVFDGTYYYCMNINSATIGTTCPT